MGCAGCRQMTSGEKIKSIVTGWKNVIWKSPEIEAEAIRRVEICADCNHNRATICKVCSCWIPAKARSMDENCPINKWHE